MVHKKTLRIFICTVAWKGCEGPAVPQGAKLRKFLSNKNLRQLQTRVHVNAGIITGGVASVYAKSRVFVHLCAFLHLSVRFSCQNDLQKGPNLRRMVQKCASSAFMQYRYNKQGLECWIRGTHVNWESRIPPPKGPCRTKITTT